MTLKILNHTIISTTQLNLKQQNLEKFLNAHKNAACTQDGEGKGGNVPTVSYIPEQLHQSQPGLQKACTPLSKAMMIQTNKLAGIK